MAFQTHAYKSSTGKLFSTYEEAENDEIRAAAEALGGADASHLINVATGASVCRSTRAAILRLAEAIKDRPQVEPGAQ